MYGASPEDLVETHAAVIGPNVLHGVVGAAHSLVIVYLDVERVAAGSATAWPSTPRAWVQAAQELQLHPLSAPTTAEDAQQLAERLTTSLVGARVSPPTEHPSLARVRRHVADNLHGDLRAATVASSVGLSASRLSQLFAAELGLPLRAYVRWTRLRAAARRMQAGDSLTTAAAEAGFADSAHLSRTFQEMFGIAPSQVTRGADWVLD